MLRLKQPVPFGLDISDHVVRVLQLTPSAGTGSGVAAIGELLLPDGLVHGGVIVDAQGLSERIRTLLKHARIAGAQVISVLPEPQTFIKLIEIPKGVGKNISEAIAAEVPTHIPFAVEEVVLDWQLVAVTDSTYQILIGAADKHIAEQYLELIERARLTPVALETEAAAIVRVTAEAEVPVCELATAILDLGQTRNTLMVYDHGTLQFTVSLGSSGRQALLALASRLGTDIAQAARAVDAALTNPAQAPAVVLEHLSAMSAAYAKGISDADTFYQAHFGNGRPLGRVLLVGSGSAAADIGGALSTPLELPVSVVDPWTLNAIRLSKRESPPVSNAFTTVLGLAWRGLHLKLYESSHELFQDVERSVRV